MAVSTGKNAGRKSRAPKGTKGDVPALPAPVDHVARADGEASSNGAAVATAMRSGAALPPARHEKQKLVRDSFTIPADEYEALGRLKQRAVALARPAKKSELLRAGLKLLVALEDERLLEALGDVPAVKTGRPKAKKAERKN